MLRVIGQLEDGVALRTVVRRPFGVDVALRERDRVVVLLSAFVKDVVDDGLCTRLLDSDRLTEDDHALVLVKVAERVPTPGDTDTR